MRARVECIPCYFKQALSAINKAGIHDEKEQVQVLFELMKAIPNLDVFASPAEVSTYVLQHVSEVLDIPDPFLKAKKEANKIAMQLIGSVRERIDSSETPLFTAIRAAVAGNIVDLGILESYDLEGTLEEAFCSDFAVWDFEAFEKLIGPGKPLLYIGDNTGEIVFDKLLIEELQKIGLVVTFAVKEEPILNDATMEDAIEVGMDKVAKVITNGNGFMGTIVSECSEEFLKALDESDVVIAKGQANYESLEGTKEAGEKTFFILKIKCPFLAETIPGTKMGDMVFLRNRVKKP
jgi:uncharacterized protein with ATP-grasp and redox domains